jgi:post-segregation antitoxin (ccd killing protein)
MSMASTRTTFTLDDDLLARAHRLNINISAAARQGVTDAVQKALVEADRAAYQQHPERPDPFWDDARTWIDE